MGTCLEPREVRPVAVRKPSKSAHTGSCFGEGRCVALDGASRPIELEDARSRFNGHALMQMGYLGACSEGELVSRRFKVGLVRRLKVSDTTNVDVLIVGGGLGGVSAALGAASLGASVLLVEKGNWLGGQLTSQGVCTPDEVGIDGQQVVETCGSTASYRAFRHQIREWYRAKTTLSGEGQAVNPLNIGKCWVNSGFAAEPSVAMGVLQSMLTEANVVPMLGATVSGPPVSGRLIKDVTVTGSEGTSLTVRAGFILDATETGDLLPLFNLPWHIGAEAQSDTTEPDASAEAHPEWIQAITYPIALIRKPVGENHTIAKPDCYEEIKRAQQFQLKDGCIEYMFKEPNAFWSYRRVIYEPYFDDNRYACDLATINVGSNDYTGGMYPDDNNPSNNIAVLAAARRASQAFVYWLQTETPHDDDPKKHGYPELMPATAFFNTADGISPDPYIREARRVDPLVRVIQQDIGANYNAGLRARNFKDACGIGNYSMDIHACANGGPGLWENNKTRPYQIPAGALVPKECDNLIAAGKCLGVTHITNGAYRLHPQEWNTGEAAGVLAAFCAQAGCTPAQAVTTDPLLPRYQNALLSRGVPLFWWSDVSYGDPAWRHIQMCGVRGIFKGYADSLRFGPCESFDDAAKAAIEQSVGKPMSWPDGPMTRSQAAQVVAAQMGWVP